MSANLIGRVFGRLTVQGAEKKGGRMYHPCACECGGSKTVRVDNLTSGRTVSCGCVQIEAGKKAATRNNAKRQRRGSGIRSITDVRERCSKRGECWIWTNYTNKHGNPLAMLRGKPGQMVRRWVYEQSHKNEPGFVMPSLVGASCGNGLCCNPAHLIPESYKDRAERSAANIQHPELRARRIVASRIAAGLTKLTSIEQARAIRADSRPHDVVAAEYGIKPGTVQSIRLGLKWREPAIAGGAIAAMAAVLGGVAA